MDFKNKMLMYMLYLVLFKTVFSQLLSETSSSRIFKRFDRLENDVLVIRDDVLVIRKALKEESDVFREDISTLFNELRNLRKDLDEERKRRIGDISTVSYRLTESGQVERNDKEPVSITQQVSCDCGAVSSQFKNVINAFKNEKSENIVLRKKFDEMKKEHDFEIGNLLEMFNNNVSGLYSTDRSLRSEIDTIKTETKANLSATQKLVHDSFVVCKKDINYARAYFDEGLMRLNESLTNLSLNALHEKSRITSDIASLITSKEILNNVTDNLIQLQRHHPQSCDFVEKSGTYKIYPSSHPNGIMVYCYKESANKGWIVIQRRADGSVNFNRTWADYKAGFGDLSGEFWLGNENIYQLTKNEPRELRIDMEAFNGTKRYALYSKFSISSESEKFKLHVDGYSGDAGDDLTKPTRTHNGQSFSTVDADNDISSACCVCSYGGGWWYNNCFESNLNGKYLQRSEKVIYNRGIIWPSLTGWNTSLKFVAMNIR
ncbi:hypothetical protein DPMN_145215 [Dreissena polymorpha]|uniref:Fibrinogen C-terminal domain-containing protein n=2 Tax=Dreissena polymorpha TaxID=45954 RepID=A0A9D4F7Y5_DREPO|nr:hypothetical protein DPMN_145215 [Dreissena polymorpha]